MIYLISLIPIRPILFPVWNNCLKGAPTTSVGGIKFTTATYQGIYMCTPCMETCRKQLLTNNIICDRFKAIHFPTRYSFSLFTSGN